MARCTGMGTHARAFPAHHRCRPLPPALRVTKPSRRRRARCSSSAGGCRCRVLGCGEMKGLNALRCCAQSHKLLYHVCLGEQMNGIPCNRGCRAPSAFGTSSCRPFRRCLGAPLWTTRQRHRRHRGWARLAAGPVAQGHGCVLARAGGAGQGGGHSQPNSIRSCVHTWEPHCPLNAIRNTALPTRCQLRR